MLTEDLRNPRIAIGFAAHLYAPGSPSLPNRGVASTLLEAKQDADAVWREWALAAGKHHVHRAGHGAGGVM